MRRDSQKFLAKHECFISRNLKEFPPSCVSDRLVQAGFSRGIIWQILPGFFVLFWLRPADHVFDFQVFMNNYIAVFKQRVSLFVEKIAAPALDPIVAFLERTEKLIPSLRIFFSFRKPAIQLLQLFFLLSKVFRN